MGRLIVIEGLDGSGKATQAAKLAAHLQSIGERVQHVSFPNYKSDSSALVRLYLSGAMGAAGDVNAYAASCFYAVDRYCSFEMDWKKQYEAGYTILADRYATSNAVHQMTKLPKEEWDGYLAWMEDFEYTKMHIPRPDMVLYLDMHPDTSRVLLEKRYAGDLSKRDIHESDIAYLYACRKAALYAAERLKWQVLRCCDGKNPFPVEDIFADILSGLQRE